MIERAENELVVQKDVKTLEQPPIFHRFSELPAEIRILIWREALHRPRLINVYLESFYTGVMPTSEPPWPNGPTTHPICFPKFVTRESRSPPLLHACRESRDIALEAYDICLSTTIDPSITFYKRHGDKNRERQILTYRGEPGAPSLPSQRYTISKIGRICVSYLSSLSAAFYDKFRNDRRGRVVIPHREVAAPGIFFQPHLDTIYFRYSPDAKGCLFYLPTAELKADNIRSVALDKRLLDMESRFWRNMFAIRGFPSDTVPLLNGLKKAIIVSEGNYFASDAFHFESLRYHIMRKPRDANLRMQPEFEVMTRSDMDASNRWDVPC